MTRRWVRWTPAVAAPAVVLGAVLAAPLQAGAAVDLPDRTPAELIDLVASSDVTAFSATIEQTSDLGLPELDLGAGSEAAPTTGGDDASATALELLTGSHAARVFADGPDRSRLQILDEMAERDVIRSGSEVWLYDSSDRSAVRVTLPERDAETPNAVATPAELADRFLDGIDDSTEVSVGTDATIAGRAAYELILTPRTADTLVAAVSIGVDAETGLPLSVTVDATGQDEPAFRVAVTDLTLGAPDASLFDFAPPAGATVTEETLDAKRTDADAAEPADGPDVTGSDWTSIVEIPADEVPTDVDSAPLLDQLLTPVDGGRGVSTSLVSVLLTDDGRLLAGSVPLDALVAAASE